MVGRMLGSLCNVVFAFIFVGNTLWSAALMSILGWLPMPRKIHQEWSLWLVRCAWTTSLALSPWIRRIRDTAYEAEWEKVHKKLEVADAGVAAEKHKPVFVLSNHTSFADVPLSAVVLPWFILKRSRTYMANHLFKIPVLASICRAVGHFPVHFQSDEAGKFKVDAEKMAPVERRVESHLDDGGCLIFFPEGQVNKDPDALLPFRYGGLKKALERDARIVIFAAYGNPTVWPRKSQLAGYPGTLRYGAKAVAPDGCKAYVKELRDGGLPEDERNLEDCALLAKRLQATMQQMYNDYKSEVCGNAGKKD